MAYRGADPFGGLAGAAALLLGKAQVDELRHPRVWVGEHDVARLEVAVHSLHRSGLFSAPTHTSHSSNLPAHISLRCGQIKLNSFKQLASPVVWL